MKPSEYQPEVGYYKKEYHDYYEVFFKTVPVGSRVIELGCGNAGLISQLSRKKKCVVAGADISLYAERRCKAKKIKFYRVDLENREQMRKIPFSNFDIVIMAATLEHMVDPKKVLRVLASCLSPRQIVLIGVPNCSDLITRLRVLRGDGFKRYGETKKDLGIGVQPEGHFQFFNPKSLRDLVEKTGFSFKKFSYQGSQRLKPFWLRWLYKIDSPLFKPFFVVECQKSSKKK